jgi:Ala-tRNA(Pro) deacylase
LAKKLLLLLHETTARERRVPISTWRVVMPAKTLKKFLDTNGVKYVSIVHSPAYTAQEIAESAHVPGGELAKTVILKLDGKMAMAVLPASYRVDFDLLRGAARASTVELATEEEFKGKFPDADVGAMPPFGNLYGMDVYVDEVLTRDREIAFNAGRHTELIRMAYSEFERLAKPSKVRISSAYA